MPLAVENLTPRSTDEEIEKAISESIATCVKEGRPRDQCAAIAHKYAREKTNKSDMRLGFATNEGGVPRGETRPMPGAGGGPMPGMGGAGMV